MIEHLVISNRAEWLEWRRKVLTASDIGAVHGVDPYRTALSVYAEKTEFITQPENPMMRRGRMFEAAAVEYLREEHPTWTIWRPNAFYFDLEQRLGCTPDALATDDDAKLVNIQIKCIAQPVFERWEGVAPLCYQLQTCCENLLLDPDRSILAVLVVSAFDAQLVEFPIGRHQGVEDRIREIATSFWANIAASRYPAPNYERDAEIIAHLYPPKPEVAAPLDLTQDNRIYTLLEDRDRAKQDIKALEGQVSTFDAEIKFKLAGAATAIADGWKISNTTIERPEHLVKASKYQRLNVSRTATEEAAA